MIRRGVIRHRWGGSGAFEQRPGRVAVLAGVFTLALLGGMAGALAPAAAAQISTDNILIRVALNKTIGSIPDLDQDSVAIVSQSEVTLSEAATGQLIGTVPAAVKVLFTRTEKGIDLKTVDPATNAEAPLASVSGKVIATGAPDKLLGVPTLTRPKSNPYPMYHGTLEVAPSPVTPGKLRIINVLAFEDYLKGIVPNEMPTSFNLEALKAQAIAARGYTLANMTKHAADDANICDSTHCHVYYGALTEDPKSSEAVTGTTGLVATYEQDVIDAVYSSTAGGYTENNENVWSDWATKTFPGKPLPYLRGVPDDEGVGPLDSEEAARAFLTARIGSFDSLSSYLRWQVTWTRQQLEDTINVTLAKRAAADSTFVTPAFPQGAAIGALQSLKVLERGVSGKIMSLAIEGNSGTWVVKKELNIRFVLKPPTGSLALSANMYFDQKYDEAGNLVSVTAYGAGYGHGVGMSQWGANGMAAKGYTFDKILRHYYSGIALGTKPVYLQYGVGSPDSASQGLKQAFFVPGEKATLVINNFFLKAVEVRVNGGEPLLVSKELAPDGIARIDISAYIKAKDLNTITYAPVTQTYGAAKVSVEVE